MRVTAREVLPVDWVGAVLVGRFWFGGAPIPVVFRNGDLYDISGLAPTLSHLFDLPSPAIAIAGGVTAGLSSYLYFHFWGLKPQGLSYILFIGPFASFLALWGAPRLAQRFGKKETMLGFYGTWLITAIIPMCGRLVGLMPANGSRALMVVLTADLFIGVGLAVGCHIVLSSMLSDASEDIAVKTGHRSEGVLFAAYGLVGKCGGGVGAFLSGLLLLLVGFPEKAAPGTVDPQS
jgi:GPH family glycoside/pentoside/hexuronide:cation symporter